jgi:hypothetical protein
MKMIEQENMKNALILELRMLDELEEEMQKLIARLRLHKHFVNSALSLKKVVKTDGGLYLFEEEEEKRVLTFPTKDKD